MTSGIRQFFLLPIFLLTLVGMGNIAAQQSRSGPSPRQTKIVEPPELTGLGKQMPTPLTAAQRRFAESKALQSLDTKDVKTLAPAIRELTTLIQQEPIYSDAYFMRASVSCEAKADKKSILNDITMSLATRASSKSSAYDTLADHYTLKAKVELESGQYQAAMNDLDTAIKQNYESAEQIFNDGNVKPTTTILPCVWTLPDLERLAQKFPADYRPHLYRGLYLSYFASYSRDSDYQPILKEFERAAILNPASPLPHYFIGGLYTVGRLGGLFSTANAVCLDYVLPRMPECLELDKLHQKGVRSLTRAIALDPQFRPAYAMRAEAFMKLKQYRQAIRDYDKVLELDPKSDAVRGIYNDRGLAKMELGNYQAAVRDFDAAIAKGCERFCNTYENRAEAYLKLHDYAKAISDIGSSIKKELSNDVFIMNIDQFRQIYPEYFGAFED